MVKRDTEILPPGPLGWQQFRAFDKKTKLLTVSRTCAICGKFYLVRTLKKAIAALSPDQKRFVLKNRTPCEADDGSAKETGHAET